MTIKKLISFALVMSMLFLLACGGGGGGGGATGEGDPTPTPIPDPEPVVGALTVEQAQDAVYAVYAGIGYNKSILINGNALMYDVMVDNFSSLAGNLIIDTIFNGDDAQNKLINFALTGKSTFDFNSDSCTSTLELKRTKTNIITGINDFSATLSVAFNKTGYKIDDITKFYGTDSMDNLKAEFTGKYKANTSGLDALIIETVKVNAGNGLVQKTSDSKKITFEKWSLNYDIDYDNLIKPTNFALLPIGLDVLLPEEYSPSDGYADFRDYTVAGTFTVNDSKKYTFANGFRYKQEQWSYNKQASTIISANGKLSVPGLNGYVTVSSVLDSEDPFTNNTIISHVLESGDWTNEWESGKLVFSGTDADTTAVFNNGSVNFTSGSSVWTVDNWQTALNPIK